MEEVILMKGNEAVAHAAVRAIAMDISDILLHHNRKSWKP